MEWVTKEQLPLRARGALRAAGTLLDIGPGIRPQEYVLPNVHICCEPAPQYVERLQEIASKAIDRHYVILQMNWAEAVRHLPSSSVDTVILADVIEHLEKDEGKQLLERTLQLARSQVAVFTPLGFVPQCHPDDRDAWGIPGGAAWQAHLSGWMPDDFSEGWKVFACREFHFADNMGNPLPKPEGALWAIHDRTPIGKANAGRSVRTLARFLRRWVRG